MSEGGGLGLRDGGNEGVRRDGEGVRERGRESVRK